MCQNKHTIKNKEKINFVKLVLKDCPKDKVLSILEPYQTTHCKWSCDWKVIEI